MRALEGLLQIAGTEVPRLRALAELRGQAARFAAGLSRFLAPERLLKLRLERECAQAPAAFAPQGERRRPVLAPLQAGEGGTVPLQGLQLVPVPEQQRFCLLLVADFASHIGATVRPGHDIADAGDAGEERREPPRLALAGDIFILGALQVAQFGALVELPREEVGAHPRQAVAAVLLPLLQRGQALLDLWAWPRLVSPLKFLTDFLHVILNRFDVAQPLRRKILQPFAHPFGPRDLGELAREAVDLAEDIDDDIIALAFAAIGKVIVLRFESLDEIPAVVRGVPAGRDLGHAYFLRDTGALLLLLLREIFGAHRAVELSAVRALARLHAGRKFKAVLARETADDAAQFQAVVRDLHRADFLGIRVDA